MQGLVLVMQAFNNPKLIALKNLSCSPTAHPLMCTHIRFFKNPLWVSVCFFFLDTLQIPVYPKSLPTDPISLSPKHYHCLAKHQVHLQDSASCWHLKACSKGSYLFYSFILAAKSGLGNSCPTLIRSITWIPVRKFKSSLSRLHYWHMLTHTPVGSLTLGVNISPILSLLRPQCPGSSPHPLQMTPTTSTSQSAHSFMLSL